jgi:hypothetical protein
VPYILAEDPEITGTEARDRSARMMEGSKWAAFVYDLSFLGWILLGILTLGILNLLWTSPYKDASDAELFRWLSGDREAPESADHGRVIETEVVPAASPEETEDGSDDSVTFVN